MNVVSQNYFTPNVLAQKDNEIDLFIFLHYPGLSTCLQDRGTGI